MHRIEGPSSNPPGSNAWLFPPGLVSHKFALGTEHGSKSGKKPAWGGGGTGDNISLQPLTGDRLRCSWLQLTRGVLWFPADAGFALNYNKVQRCQTECFSEDSSVTQVVASRERSGSQANTYIYIHTTLHMFICT